MGQRIIRDRWGEPIIALPPEPKPPEPRTGLLRLIDWVWRNSPQGPDMKKIDWFKEISQIYKPHLTTQSQSNETRRQTEIST